MGKTPRICQYLFFFFFDDFFFFLCCIKTVLGGIKFTLTGAQPKGNVSS